MSEFLLRDLPRYECLKNRAERYPTLDVEAVLATLALLRVSADVNEGLSAHLETRHLSQGRFIVLMVLDRSADHALSPSELAEKMGVRRATMTGLLDGLQKADLIERRVLARDRRGLTIHLTAQGEQFLAEMLPEYYRRIAALMGHLDAQDRADLGRILGKVREGLSAFTDPIHSAPAPV